jgi:hypothetical protein
MVGFEKPELPSTNSVTSSPIKVETKTNVNMMPPRSPVHPMQLRKTESACGSSLGSAAFRVPSLNPAVGYGSYDVMHATSKIEFVAQGRDESLGRPDTEGVMRKLSAPAYETGLQGRWPGVKQGGTVLHPPLGMRVSRSSPTALTSVEEAVGRMLTRDHSYHFGDSAGDTCSGAMDGLSRGFPSQV